MDSWILGLRADEDVQLEFRALLGPSLRSVGRVEVHAFEASSRAAAARLINSAAACLGYAAAALCPDEAAVLEDGLEARPAEERVAALCLAAAPGEFLFTLQAARSLAPALCFTRARSRPGWRLPLPCAALSDAPRLRSACQVDAATLPERPPFTGRDDELDALAEALASGGPVPFAVVRASAGMGATRLVHEAAARADVALVRLVFEGASVSADAIASALAGAPAGVRRWLILEAREPAASLSIDLTGVAARAEASAVVAIVAPDCDTPWCPPDREIELGPIAPAECRALVRGLLGPSTEDMLVQRFARKSGVPGRLVTLVRAAALTGDIVRDNYPPAPAWRPRNRRLLDLSPRAVRLATTDRRLDALDALTRRALEVAAATGDGASEHALRGVLRVIAGPGDHLGALRAYGLVALTGGTVDLGHAARTPPDVELAGRVEAMRRMGMLEVLVEAERALSQRSPDTASLFARAARVALAAGDRAAAVRLLAGSASLPRPPGDASLEAAMRMVAAELGAVVAVTPSVGSRAYAAQSASPEALEAAAIARESRGDAPAAMRLRALAGLLKGDASLARRVGTNGSSVRDHLLGALAHARESRVTAAIRSAVAALSQARKERDAGGEAATLAMLASLFHAVGRHDDAVRLAAAIGTRAR